VRDRASALLTCIASLNIYMNTKSPPGLVANKSYKSESLDIDKRHIENAEI
jgi:hypothetical protein